MCATTDGAYWTPEADPASLSGASSSSSMEPESSGERLKNLAVWILVLLLVIGILNGGGS